MARGGESWAPHDATGAAACAETLRKAAEEEAGKVSREIVVDGRGARHSPYLFLVESTGALARASQTEQVGRSRESGF